MFPSFCLISFNFGDKMKKNQIIIALLSISLISIELAWTRIFSAEYFYTFAFLILSAAILGMGMGALSLRLFPVLNKNLSISIVVLLSAISAIVSPPLVIKLKLDFTLLFTSSEMLQKLLAAILLLGSAFFFGGIALSYFFRKDTANMNRLYMADLAGAGSGVLLAIISMNLFSVPVTVFLIPIPMLIASLLFNNKWMKLIPAAIIIVTIFLSLNSWEYLNSGKKERARVVYTHWDAMSKIKVFEYDKDYRGINIDNAANSPIYGFDGNWNKPDSMLYGYSIDVSYLMKKSRPCTFLSLGAGGGTDVLQALQYGAGKVYAVEVNPHINYIMQYGSQAKFSGNIYTDKRVNVVTEDARTFVKRNPGEFDIIYSLSSNTFAALASGSFALAENYLFTKEAFIDYWNSLSPKGYMMMEHQFYIPRLTAELIEAFKELGISSYRNHFAVYKLPGMRREMILLSKQPLDKETLKLAFGEVPAGAPNYHYLLYPAPDSLKDNLVNTIVKEGWQKASEKSLTDISPSTDDRPFTAQLGLWKNFNMETLKEIKPFEFFGFPLSKVIILTIIGIILVLIIPLNFLPFIKKGDKLKAAPWLYFFMTGIGFMFVEIVLIQKYALYIGASIYSIVSVLLSLLAGSAAGSYFSNRIKDKYAFAGILIMLAMNILVIPYILELNFLVSLDIFYRAALSVLFTLPLGFFMGMPFPKGAIKVGELIDWCFAINGIASVLGSVLIIYIAFSFGFTISIIFAALVYLLAYILLTKIKSA
jgi:spermidine synthase